MAGSSNHPKPSAQILTGYILGPLLFIFLAFFSGIQPDKPQVAYTLAIAVLMAIWWITELIPLAVTALLPLVLFPVFGVMDGKEVATTYFNDIIFLFIGGFLVAIAMQRWDLHKRIALKILTLTGISPGRILLGFMVATAFLSMWISNSATAMMMIPILLSVIQQIEKTSKSPRSANYTVGLLLGMAYSASIGGMATLVGTPPNQAFASIYHITFPDAQEISFADWFFFASPFCVVLIAMLWFYIYHYFKMGRIKEDSVEPGIFRNQLAEMGPMTFEQKLILADFLLLALLWLTRAGLDFGSVSIPGWTHLFKNPKYINDGTVAIFMGIILFLVPSKREKGSRLLNWEDARDIPWNIVLLFGGGFALAAGFMESGLSLWIGNQLKWVTHLHPIVIIFAIALMMTFLTELTSNTATTQMILPILAGLSMTSDIPPLLLMIPATLSASMAFMLPVATPPNAIIFGTNRIRVAQMARAGLWLNLVGAVFVTLFTYFFASRIFNF